MLRTNRRTFIQGATALGLASTLPRAAFAQPTRGGRLRAAMGHGSTSDSFDPALYSNFYMRAQTFARNNMLTEIAPDQTLRGELAERFEANATADVWRFKIREGVEFHNGKTLTPEDVVASIDYHRVDGSKSAVKSSAESIAEISIDGPWVVMTLHEPNADFAYLISDFHFSIFPSENGKIDFSEGVGTGGYVVESYEPGVRTEFKRFANYWKPDSAYFDEIELLTVADKTARITAIATGQVDIADRIDATTASRVESASGVRLFRTSGPQHFSFAMNVTQDPFTDRNVRLALKYAVNREEMVEKILGGYGSVGNDHPIPSSSPYFNADLEQHSYDPDRARFHMKEAGLDSISTELHAADAAFTGAVDAATLYSESARAAGIDIKVAREPNDGYWKNIWRNKPWAASFWSGRPTADAMFSLSYASGAPWNETAWNNERFDKILIAARGELDEGKRREMYHEMQKLVHDDGGAVIPMFADYIVGLRDTVATPEVTGNNLDLDGLRFLERWWMA